MKLEVGKKYRTREGEVVTIVKNRSNSPFPYIGDNYLTFTEKGHWLSENLSIHDIIEEIKETKMKLEVGKYYKNRKGNVVMICNYYEDRLFPYLAGEESYLENGHYYCGEESSHDLIEEVVPIPAYRVKAEQTDMRDFIGSMEGEKGKVYTKFETLVDSKKLVKLGDYTYFATQVDAGYIDPITGEFIMNESKSKSKKLKLEVGKTYRTRGVRS